MSSFSLLRERLSRVVRILFFTAAAGGVVLCGDISVVMAETLELALAKAYADNPRLNAERAKLSATDEGLQQALSGARPSVSANLNIGYSRFSVPGQDPTDLMPRSVTIAVTQNLFDGFRTLNSVKQADALIEAGRQSLYNVEQEVLSSATSAYMNLVRDNAVLRLRSNNLSLLREQLRATKDRFDVGEVTRTDVAYAQAIVDLASSELSSAYAQLSSSQAVYEQVIGHFPDDVSQPRARVDLLPSTIDEAIELAQANHPEILAAFYVEQAAIHQIGVNQGALYPNLSLQASLSRRYDVSRSGDESNVAQVTGQLNIPLYQSGRASSLVRQSKRNKEQRRLEIEIARRRVRASVISAWGKYQASKALIRSGRAQIEASKIAMNGTQKEEEAGQRTTLDVLQARQDLIDAEVAYQTALRDDLVALYALLAAVGKLKVENLNLPVEIYDPMVHYVKVRDTMFGFSSFE